MDFMLPVSRYVALPLLQLKNRNRDMRFVGEAERAQYLPRAELDRYQFDRLKQLLIHAGKNCPFYAARFAEARFDPTMLSSTQDIVRIPFLTKADIQQHRTDMLATNFGASDYVEYQTGGSTGAPLRFFVSRESVYRRNAKAMRHDRWAGLESYHKSAAIWGHRSDLNDPRSVIGRLRDAVYARRVILDTSEISRVKLGQFVERLRKEKPTVYLAYANSMFLIARYIKERGIRAYHKPRSIITSAEVLTDEQRHLIEEVFECPVYNRYGCWEFSVVASECDAHTGMHIAADTLLVEIVRGDRVCRPGEPGEIVITDLHNYAMPLIRYRIADVGVLLDTACPCGRTLPLMNVVGGRVTDFLVTPEGTAVSGAAMTIYFIARVPGIAQAQLVQRERDLLVLRLATSPDFGAQSRQMIDDGVRRFFGPKMRYEIELVDSIPVLASGKYRFSISQIDPLEYL